MPIHTAVLLQYERVCVHTGKVELKVSAEALRTEVLCGNEVAAVPDMGRVDTVIRSLLVEVSDQSDQSEPDPRPFS